MDSGNAVWVSSIDMVFPRAIAVSLGKYGVGFLRDQDETTPRLRC
jgi:hypothetical protein